MLDFCVREGPLFEKGGYYYNRYLRVAPDDLPPVRRAPQMPGRHGALSLAKRQDPLVVEARSSPAGDRCLIAIGSP